MLELIKGNIYNILAVVVFIGVCVILVRKGYEAKVKQMLFYLVCKAEELYGSGTGELKYAAVVTWVYEQLPSILKLLFTKSQVDKWIEEAVVKMKEYLSRNTKANMRINNALSVGPGTVIVQNNVNKVRSELQKHLEEGFHESINRSRA